MKGRSYYDILGLSQSATEEEIRRAYRILARRYHPDVNPEHAESGKFQEIAEAYNILCDETKRKEYDLRLVGGKIQGSKVSLNRKKRTFGRTKSKGKFFHTQQSNSSKNSGTTNRSSNTAKNDNPSLFKNLNKFFTTHQVNPNADSKVQKTSAAQNTSKGFTIVEVNISTIDAIRGCKKNIEIDQHGTPIKISVNIPAGVHTGSITRMNSKKLMNEELIIITHLLPDPNISFTAEGLTVSLPVTIDEAYHGATIQVPTLKDPVILKVPPLSQSGKIFRLSGKGPKNRDGKVTDLFFSLKILGPTTKLPKQYSQLIKELGSAYSAPRSNTLLDK